MHPPTFLAPPLIQRPRKGHAAEPQVRALPRKERQRALPQRLLAQHVLVLGQLRPLDGALPAAVQLPQLAVLRLDEGDVVQVDVGLGLGRLSGALAGGLAVRRGEVMVGLEEGGALGRGEGDGLLDEGVQG